MILYPMTLISMRLKSLWYKLLHFGLEFSGPVFVKLG
jgi:hypothetical protein